MWYFNHMHELSITENVLAIALKHAGQAQAKKINIIYLVVGQFSSIVDDSVQFYWDMIAHGTLAEGAQLEFKRLPARLKCKKCQLIYQPDGKDFACPDCQNIDIEIISGEEFYVEAIDIETETSEPTQ